MRAPAIAFGMLACVLVASTTRAAEDMSAPVPPVERLQVVLEPRPRFTVAVGAGVSFDAAGFSPARTEAVPALFATGGVGADWPVGAELALFASTAVGRFRAPDSPIDRLALAAIGVLRPFAWQISAGDDRYRARLVRATGLEFGPCLERDGTTLMSGSRWGLHVGVRFEIPLGPRAGDGTEVRLRLAARRMVGFYTPQIGVAEVGDSAEAYASLVTIF